MREFRTYYDEPLSEFLDKVRESAIVAGLPEVFIAKVDEVCVVVDEYDEDALVKARADGYEGAEKEAEDDVRELEAAAENMRSEFLDYADHQSDCRGGDGDGDGDTCTCGYLDLYRKYRGHR